MSNTTVAIMPSLDAPFRFAMARAHTQSEKIRQILGHIPELGARESQAIESFITQYQKQNDQAVSRMRTLEGRWGQIQDAPVADGEARLAVARERAAILREMGSLLMSVEMKSDEVSAFMGRRFS